MSSISQTILYKIRGPWPVGIKQVKEWTPLTAAQSRSQGKETDSTIK